MPSETIYFKNHHLEVLEKLIEANDDINNRSQAVQELIENHD